MEYFDGGTYSDLEEVVEEDEDFLFGMGLKGYESEGGGSEEMRSRTSSAFTR